MLEKVVLHVGLYKINSVMISKVLMGVPSFKKQFNIKNLNLYISKYGILQECKNLDQLLECILMMLE